MFPANVILEHVGKGNRQQVYRQECSGMHVSAIVHREKVYPQLSSAHCLKTAAKTDPNQRIGNGKIGCLSHLFQRQQSYRQRSWHASAFVHRLTL